MKYTGLNDLLLKLENKRRNQQNYTPKHSERIEIPLVTRMELPENLNSLKLQYRAKLTRRHIKPLEELEANPKIQMEKIRLSNSFYSGEGGTDSPMSYQSIKKRVKAIMQTRKNIEKDENYGLKVLGFYDIINGLILSVLRKRLLQWNYTAIGKTKAISKIKARNEKL